MHLIEVLTATDEVELVSDRAWSAGAEGIWEIDSAGGEVIVRVGVTAPARDAVLEALRPWAPSDVTDRDAVALASTDVQVVVDGMALAITVPPTVFGDGNHATTQGCLAALAELVAEATTVLDVGCGSGILSVAAAARGGRVRAVDIDAAAVAATEANAARAHLSVDASTTPLDGVTGRFDVVVANISAGTVLELAAALDERVGAHGHLVLSGILAERWPEVHAAFGDWMVRSQRDDQGWCTAVLAPPAVR